MLKLCIGDSLPVVVTGLESYFQKNTLFEVAAVAENLETLLSELDAKKIDILLLDIELNGLSSIRDIKSLVLDYPATKIVLFTGVSEQMYGPTAYKSGVAAYISKNTALVDLEKILLQVTKGNLVYSEAVKKNIAAIKGNKKDRLFKKLSTREIEVLRYLNDGKKNKEVAQLLCIDEKTISTYKLRLLAKLSVTNLVDLLKKAKDLDII